MEKWELAYKDYKNGMKYKDIAKKHDVSINTVKSWKSRKWGATDTRKVAYKPKKQPVIKNNNLTEQQKKFCLLYLKHFNQTKAYQQAYQCDYASARANASRLIAKDDIKEELYRLKAEAQHEIFAEAKDIAQEYVKQAFSDYTDFVEFGTEMLTNELGEEYPSSYVRLKNSDEVDGTLIKEVSKGKDGSLTVKLWDKQKAQQQLEKYFNFDELREVQIEKVRMQIEQLKQSTTVDKSTEDKIDELLDAIVEGIKK